MNHYEIKLTWAKGVTIKSSAVCLREVETVGGVGKSREEAEVIG